MKNKRQSENTGKSTSVPANAPLVNEGDERDPHGGRGAESSNLLNLAAAPVALIDSGQDVLPRPT